jgi:D-alanyl-lipoteichoic acid acyltransferase DltB (MBOAT superfamily)
MLFNSYAFLFVFLPAAIALYALVERRRESRIPALIALSFMFYGYWDIRFAPLLAGSILVNWLAARWYIASHRAGIITLAIAANLAVLGFFKYWNFFGDNVALVAGTAVPHLDIALPLGISFFTFHHIMYLVDLRRGIAPPIPLDRYALYICFFPQVLSGPLVRWHEVVHQFGGAVFTPGWQKRFSFGVTLIILGLAQKVFLGDGLAGIVNPIYERAARGAVGCSEAWLATLGFSFQIFFDFSGYTDIAIGLALIFAIELPRNFDAPYRATSIREFWRRWHMTLSRFLRDYLYVPLGGNRHGLSVQIGALLATMLLGGLWHGAAWGFVVWGVVHGIALVIDLLWRRWSAVPLPAVIGWIATFAFVTLAWVFFRSPSFAAAGRMLEALAVGGTSVAHDGWRTVMIAAFCAIVLPSSYEIGRRLNERPRTGVALGLSAASAALIVALGSDASYEFIYFRF